ncbi:hypothetical protein ACP3TJ_10355 [Desulforudis sp. 1088]|uniref:hypothetical protein n=1 Tax=unclassified Candidatus Desulforudis TaxID=2635950 RepID=UPI003CE55BE7
MATVTGEQELVAAYRAAKEIEALIEGEFDSTPLDPDEIVKFPDWMLVELYSKCAAILETIEAGLNGDILEIPPLDENERVLLEFAGCKVQESLENIMAESEARGLVCPNCGGLSGWVFGRLDRCLHCRTPLEQGKKPSLIGLRPLASV